MFPLLTLEELKASPQAGKWLAIELGREAATLLMLAGIGLALARNGMQWFAGFLVAFGVWDLFYYLFLKLFLDWPSSLFTWDLLFLLPVPWAGPVLAPMLVSVSMIVAGLIVLRCEESTNKIRPGKAAWSMIALGGCIILYSFCGDCQNLLAGHWPGPFHWSIFLIGLVIGIVGFLLGWLGCRMESAPRAPGL
jgi:hypothetical protein